MLSTLLFTAAAAVSSDYPHLPPVQAWSAEHYHAKRCDEPLVTVAECTEFVKTGQWSDTQAWLQALQSRYPEQVKLEVIGETNASRDIVMVTVTKDVEQANDLPTLLVQGGIHAGEIDGKDAGMMLLRDLLAADDPVLAQAKILFIPVLNRDGEARFSQYNRVNQRGPAEHGWRSNANNLNLNRDYTKLDTPAIQAVVAVINDYQPDLYLDLHVTDGIDYQYDVTFGFTPARLAYSKAITTLLESSYRPALDAVLTQRGHIPGDLIFANNNKDMAEGLGGWVASPRYSNGYGDARHTPTVLLENHSLKPYQQRVWGTYSFVEQSLRWLVNNSTALRAAKAKDSAEPVPVVLQYKANPTPERIDFKGIEFTSFSSPITGQTEVRWTGQSKLYRDLPKYWQDIPALTKAPAKRYYIGAEQQETIRTLLSHGVELSYLAEPTRLDVETRYARQPKFASKPFEGRFRVIAQFTEVHQAVTLPAGTAVVEMQQPLATLITLLMEPESEDSFFQWGLYNSIFQRTEYIENYAVEPIAQQMLQDPEIAKAFNERLQDPSFAGDADARLMWFYERTPYFDQAFQRLPYWTQR